jgi:hypothetical protein
MMATSWTPRIALCLTAGLAACGDGPTGPVEVTLPVRSALLHFANSGENRVWDTDQTSGTPLPASAGLVPIGAHPGERVVVLIDGTAIVTASLDRPGELDTIIAPAPSSHTLASFSDAGDLVAIAAYAPVPALLVYDRANRRVDTLSLGGAAPVLPPVFAPDGERLVLISVNDLSMFATIVPRTGPVLPSTVRLRFSRVVNRPVFGWPRWIGAGIRMAFVRLAEDGPDTLLVGTIFPDQPDLPMEEAYRTLLTPEGAPAVTLDFGSESTYALTADGSGMILGLVPVGGTSQHAVYHVGAGVERPRPIVDSAGQFPVFPLFIRE